MSTFWTFALCAFASGYALRLADPIVLPVAAAFGIDPKTAALLTTAYALPYALAQPFLGPLGDRFGKQRCMQVCITGLAVCLVLGTAMPSIGTLLLTRCAAGVFAGGLIPLLLAGIGDDHDMTERQVIIGRLLFAIIGGQMLGSAVSGWVNAGFGWRAVLGVSAAVAVLAALLAWTGLRARAPAAGHGPSSFRALYGHVFANPKAGWLYGAGFAEGVLFFGFFPYVGELLVRQAGLPLATASGPTGMVLGCFGIGGLFYALSVRRLVRGMGVRRMCLIGTALAALCYAFMSVLGTWWLHALAMAVAGYSYYMLHNSLQTQATELAPSARASAVSLFAAAFFLGQAVGPLLFGPLAHHWGYMPTLLGVAVLMLALGQGVLRRILH
jgi:DHA1 family inner membrane transport protein